jgi:hypothetical protein
MGKTDRRKYPRVKVFNTVSYSYSESDNYDLEENISVALNTCQNGIQIETFTEIKSKNIRLRFRDLQLNTLEISGEVIYCEKQQSGIFKTGIRLTGTDPENAYFVQKLVKFYNYSKEAYRPGLVLIGRSSQPTNIDTIQL